METLPAMCIVAKKAKGHLNLKLASNIKGNKKSYISSKRENEENIGLLGAR